jgi:hypothetical protein
VNTFSKRIFYWGGFTHRSSLSPSHRSVLTGGILAFLAPEMVERIAAGSQAPELTAQALRTGRFDIPVDWAAQKRALGFAQP